MKDIILIGSGGCMRELAWQMLEQNKANRIWNIQGYVDVTVPENGEGEYVGTYMIPYLGDDNYLLQQKKDVNAVLCVGSPKLRQKIVQKLLQNPYIHFPTVILGDTRICDDVKMGQGCVISMDARISTNVVLGNFVFLNIGAMVCHDGQIGDFVTLSPDVKLAGNVRIGAGSDIGIGTRVIQGVRIAEQVIAGAGSVIISDIMEACTVVGVPARRCK